MSGSARVGVARSGRTSVSPGTSGSNASTPRSPRSRLGADAGHQRTQGLREWLIGRTEILVATAVQHDRAVLIGPLGPFAGQARLADTRFAGDQHGAHTTGERGLPRRQQPFELAATPDERPGPDKYCGQAGPLHRRIAGVRLGTVLGGFQAELENMLGAREVSQLSHPQVGEHNVVGQ